MSTMSLFQLVRRLLSDEGYGTVAGQASTARRTVIGAMPHSVLAIILK